MPNWKKVITSGSAAVLSDLTLSGVTQPEIKFNGSSDAGVDMAIRATPEGLDFYEPEDSNKIHMQILDDSGVDAKFGLKIGGTSVLSSGRALSNVTGNISMFTNNSGYITNSGDTSGNAGTATALATARNIAGVSFDGTSNISLNNNAITNGAGYTTNTGTVTSIGISPGTGLDAGSAITTNGTISVSLDLSELTDMTATVDTSVDELILLDNGAERRKRFAEIFGSNAYNSTTIPTNNNQLTNGAGYITSFTNTVDMGDGFVIEDGDGTEVTITENKEIKFVEGGGIDINFTDTSTGSDGDPFDLTFTVQTLNQDTTGNAATATALETARTIAGVSFDGTGNISLNNNAITNGAGYITGVTNISGNAGTATALASARTIAGVSFDGTANISLNNESITNGAGYTTNTGTVTQVSTGAGLDGSFTTSGTITLDLSELTDMTADVVPTTDEVILLDNGAERRKRFSEIFGSNAYNSTTIPTNNNQLTNGAGYITGVTNISGNAGTATTLATARNIAGVSFDGSANISLNNNAITNGAGYTTNTGTTTPSNSQTFTNKSGNISQWTNDSGYITSFTNTVDMGDGFVIEDGDGTEVTITENKEVKFVEGGGIDINWTDTSTGSDGDPYDLTFTVQTLNQNTTGTAAGLTTGRTFRTNLASTSTATFDGTGNVTPGVTGTLAVGNGGTGLTSISTLLNSNTTATNVGLGNVTNESKATMFSSAALTGNPTAPTQAANNDSTRIATTAYVQAELTALIGTAPSTLDTLGELSASLATDISGLSALTTTVGTKLAKSSNLSDLTNAETARDNLGLGSVATKAYTTSVSNGSGAIPDGDAVYDHVTTRISGLTSNTGTVDTSGTPVDNDFAKFTDANTIEGRSISETKSDLSLNNVENTALSTYTGNGGALDNQYITNGAGYTTNTGTTTAGNSQTFTNKGGNISQWTNDSGYITSFTNTVDMGDGFIVQDGDGTNVTITEGKYLKFVEGTGIDINFTDTSNGTSGDPFDITITNTSPNVVQTTITGNAGTATALQNARTIAGVSFDGTANISLNNSNITNGAGYITSFTNTVDMGDGFKIVDGDGTEVTITENKYIKLVEGTGIDINFTDTSNGTSGDPFDITITNTQPNVTQTSVTGNAGTATALATARTIAGVSFDGTANISLNNNAITNGAGYTTNTGDITGVTVSTGNGLAGGTTQSSGNFSTTLSLNVIGMTDMTADLDGADSIIVHDNSAMTANRKTINELDLSQFDNSTSGFTTNTGTLTGNGTSGRVPIYNGTTSFTTDSGFTYSSNKLSIDGTLRSNGVDIISNTTSGTLLIGDTTDGDTIDQIKFTVMAGDNIVLEDGETAIQSAVKLTSLSAQNSEATSVMINSSGIVGTRELGSNAFTSTAHPTLANGSDNRVVTATSSTGLNGESNLTYNGSTLTVNGHFRAGVGAVSQPGFAFTSRTDSGMYLANTHDLAFSVDGSLRAFLNDNGLRVDDAIGVNVDASTTDGRIDAGNDVVAYSSSDKRWKENIKPIENALDKVLKIGGYEFDWKELTEEEKKTQHGNEGHDIGVIAQEVEKVLPEVVTTRENGFKGVKYDKMVALLIESIKELKSEIEELKRGR